MRLNRYLALCGVAARRGATELVLAGRVQVNGREAREPGQPVQVAQDSVEVDGERVRPPRRWLYLAFHKPRGLLVTSRDELGRPALGGLLRSARERVFPVGRLDRSSEGLLLLTNHGELAHALLHPRFGIERVYRVTVAPRPRPGQLARMAEGVPIGGGERSGPAEIRVRRVGAGTATLTMLLREGKKREVRRICRWAGLTVLRLRRVQFAGVRLGDLPAGQSRRLTPEELEHLEDLTGLRL
jgi:pseudouridine synthase